MEVRITINGDLIHMIDVRNRGRSMVEVDGVADHHRYEWVERCGTPSKYGFLMHRQEDGAAELAARVCRAFARSNGANPTGSDA